MPRISTFFCCFMLLSGCSALNLTSGQANTSPVEIEAEIKKYQSCRSIADVDQRLDELLKVPDGQRQAERLIQGWGKHGSWYDLAVVKLWWERWPPEEEGGKNRFSQRRLFDLTQSVLAASPELAGQVFWYFQWSKRVPDFSGLMLDLEPRFVCDYNGDGWVKYRLVLLYAGVASGLPTEQNSGESATRANWENLIGDWLDQKTLILGQRPFLRYDHELGRWVVDQEAKKSNRYLTPDEQKASPRPTPLPNWDSEIIPPRPIHEPEREEEITLLGIPD